MKTLVVGRIVETYKSIITRIVLHEIGDYWILYEKSGSLHNLMMDKIDRIEFPAGRFPALKIQFPDNRPFCLQDIPWRKALGLAGSRILHPRDHPIKEFTSPLCPHADH